MAPKTHRNGKANGFPANLPGATVLRERFETRLDDVRTRFKTFEKDWSKAVVKLSSRGKQAEKDLRKRLDKVATDLNKSQIVLRVKKNPTVKNVIGAVKGFDYEKTVKDLRREVKGFQGEVVDFFEASASRVKQVIDLPTRADFERLNRKIESLSTQVRSLERRK